MTSDARIPVVALVGRPNVGKSTLFNRFAGHRRALVADQPGLTRDRIAERIDVEGRTIWLVDTAGLDPVRGESLAAAVQAQARSAVDNADVILFIVDGKLGLVPEDEAIASTLRRSGKPLGLLVNKIDQPGHHAARVNEFYRLGIDHTYAVSAEHGGGAFDALERVLASLPFDGESAAGEGGLGSDSDEEPVRIAIVGRPNVGKSSISNRLAGEDRTVVSDEPGTTRDAVDIEIRHEGQDYTLVDTAGLRKIAKRQGPGEHGGALMTLRSLERADLALLIVDAADGIADQDSRVASLMREHGCASLVLANKWDLVDVDDRKDVLEDIQHGLRFMSDVPIVPVSAKTGAGLKTLFKKLRKVAEASQKRIPTADLNRWLKDVSEKHPPSMAHKGPIRRANKLFYASQVAVRPPTIIVVCTDPKAIQTSYVRFLENQLRDSFGFEGTPVRVLLRARSGRRGAETE